MTKDEALELVKTKAHELYEAIGVLGSLHSTGNVGLNEWKESLFEVIEELETELLEEDEGEGEYEEE